MTADDTPGRTTGRASATGPATGVVIDPDALQARYREERAKRLRPDGNDQYVEPVGPLARFDVDPWVGSVGRRPHDGPLDDRLDDEVTVALIGGGFAGLATGAKLRQAGVGDVRIIEKGADFGGTWYWNRYPGAQCDTAALVYLPLLEETGTVPSEKYVHGPEIRDHCRRLADRFGLYENACLATRVTDLTWDGDASRWVIRTDRDDVIRARFVVLGTGPLHRPKLPGIPGIETFAGHSFHTSRWDYAYTGGDPAGAPMDRLGERRVGIIGTGATAIQVVPHLARASGELYVFQRTPSSVDVRANHPIDPGWFAALEPGWQRRWLENFTILQTGGFADEDLVRDGWTDIAQRIRDKLFESPDPELTPEAIERAYHASDDEKMTEIRARVDAIVRDPATAAALKPWYRQLCKRPCFHDEYLDAFNLPNVHLVDTDGRGVERIDATGVWVAGRHVELDCLVYAAGFEVGTPYTRRSGFDLTGRDGTRLSERWSDGMVSLHGIHVHGFPNAFVVGHTQGANLISNIPHNLVEAAETIVQVIAHALAIDATEVEVTEEAERAWVELLERGGRRFGGQPDCTPGYYNGEGRDTGRRGLLDSVGYPDGPVAYFEYIERWRTSGEFAGLEFRV